MKFFALALTLIIWGSTAVHASDDLNVVRIATEEYPPYTSEKLKHYGIDSHIVSESFRAEGIDVEYQFFSGARSYAMAKEGSVDGTLPWALRSERRQYFWYSDPVIQVDHEQFYFRSGLQFEWNPTTRDYTNLEGLRLAAIISYNYGDEFQKAEADGVIQVDRVGNLRQAFGMLLLDRVDIVISKGRVATYVLQSDFTKDEIAQLDYRSENLKPASYDYLLFSKRSPNARHYLNAFNRGIKKLHASGDFDKLLRAFEAGDYITAE